MKKIFFLLVIFCTLQVNGQNITFTGIGLSSVKIENLTKDTSVTVNAGDILTLSVATGISEIENNKKTGMNIYPNPMTDRSTFEVYAPAEGDALISVYDMTGKQVTWIKTYLGNSMQKFNVSGLNKGLYLINIKANTYQLSGKLICIEKSFGKTKIEKSSDDIQAVDERKSKKDSKGLADPPSIQYSPGDILKFTGISGTNTTIVTAKTIAQDTTITFEFIACTDGDGNNYPVVEIGTQVWMAKNIKATKYTDGTNIPFINTDSLWSKLTTTDTAYCYYNNDVNNADLYGALYTWAAAMNGAASSATTPSGIQGICPTGWHLPSDAEWTILTTFLNGESSAGGKLKETGTAHWNTPNTGATNETGFTALAGGQHAPGVPSTSIGTTGFWLSSTENFKDYVWFRWLSHSAINVYRSCDMTSFGRSVRCVKNN